MDRRVVAGPRVPSIRRTPSIRPLGVLIVAGCVAASLGCDPGRYRDVELDGRSELDEVELTVGMPAAVSADPGHLTRDAVRAPRVDVSGTPIRTTMRFSAARLIADASEADASEAKNVAGKKSTAETTNAEVIPTPVPEVDNEPLSPSDPRFLRRLRARRRQQAALKNVERIPTPEGTPEKPMADPESKAGIDGKLAEGSPPLPPLPPLPPASKAAKVRMRPLPPNRFPSLWLRFRKRLCQVPIRTAGCLCRRMPPRPLWRSR